MNCKNSLLGFKQEKGYRMINNRSLTGAALTLAVLIALPMAGNVFAADTHYYSVNSTSQTAGNYNRLCHNKWLIFDEK
jgi:hypothetical protein